MQHTGTHQREGTRSHASPIAQRRACVLDRAYNDDNTLQQIVNRLTGSSGAVISQNEYTYDGVGNRKTATEKAGSATFYYSYDAAKQLKEVRTGSAPGTITGALVYDANRIKGVSFGSILTSHSYFNLW